METSIAVNMLAALAQPLRLSAFRFLVEAGRAGASVGEIRQAVGAAPATLSFHLKELHAAGLVSTQREGRSIRYRACFEAMDGLLGFLTENCCRRDGRCGGNDECGDQPTTVKEQGHETSARA